MQKWQPLDVQNALQLISAGLMERYPKGTEEHEWGKRLREIENALERSLDETGAFALLRKKDGD